jgi:eukaryotic-like serine/threonine-protein kinase
VVLATRDRTSTATNTPDGGGSPKQETARPVERPGMVYIPAGAVQIGNTEEELRKLFLSIDLKGAQVAIEDFLSYSTFPPRTEQVGAFWIDKYETSNAEYAKFVQATGHAAPTGHLEVESRWNGTTPPKGREQYPVTMVTPADARAYAEWAGKKLPTQAQFVRAFRGDKNWFYPWGNQWDEKKAIVYENYAFSGISKVTASPTDVSQFGVYNLAGNVNEMLRDTVRRDGENWVETRGPKLGVGDAFRIIASHHTLLVETGKTGKTGFRCVHEGP